MKIIHFLSFLLIFLIALPFAGMGKAHAQNESATPAVSAPVAQDTELPMDTVTPQPTATPEPPAGRPQLVVVEYHASQPTVHAGSDFDLEIRFRNDGTQPAQGVNLVFAGDNFYVRETGGVWSVPTLAPGESHTIRQPFTASWSLAGYTVGTTTLTASYNDANGVTYSDTFSISVDIYFDASWGQPTSTPVLGENPQLVVQAYHVDVAVLKPGITFTLELEIGNPGSRLAKGVKMAIGGQATGSGGSSTTGSTVSVVPFAALDSSNLIHVGDLYPGERRALSQRLIVDLQATAGVYTLPLTFQYADEQGQQWTESQGVTLIIHTTPQLKISFYENPGELLVGASSILPIQVTNVGYQTVLLGDLHLAASQDVLKDEVAYVGPLESGGSFTHDAEIVPATSGELEIRAEIDYQDAFGNSQAVVQVLTVQVVGDENLLPGGESGATTVTDEAIIPQEENFWQKLARFFRNLLGLGG